MKGGSMRKFGIWTQERVIRVIQMRYQKKWRLDDTFVRGRCGFLHYHALRHFGTWTHAVSAAGIPVDEVRKRIRDGSWTKQYLLQTILQLHNTKKPLNSRYCQQNYKGLYCAACRVFGSWREAIQKAGICYEEVCSHQFKEQVGWSKQRVIQEIQRRVLRGLSLNTSDKMNDRELRNLLAAVRRYFGTWGRAISSAGLEWHYQSIEKNYWNKTRVKFGIRYRNKHGLALSSRQWFREDPALFRAAVRLYGSRKRAMQAARVTPSRHEIKQWWTKEAILHGIQSIRERGHCLSAKYARANFNALFCAARRHWKGWGIAVQAAGFDYHKEMKVNKVFGWLRDLPQKVSRRIIDQTQDLISVERSTRNRRGLASKRMQKQKKKVCPPVSRRRQMDKSIRTS